MGKKRVLVAIIISGFASILNYAIYFVITPLITNTIGIDAYGFVSISKAFSSYASIFSSALTVYMVRFISLEYHKNNITCAKEYFSSSIVACLVISLLIMAISLFMILHLEKIINIPFDIVSSVKWLFLLSIFSLCCSIINTPFSAASVIKNRIDITGIFKVISYIFEAVFLYVLLKKTHASVWMVGLSTLFSTIIILASNYYLTIKLTPDLFFERKLVKLIKIKDLLKSGIWSAINRVGNTLNSGLDLLVSNLFLSFVQTGQLSIAKTIGNLLATLCNVVYMPLQPQLIHAYSKNLQDFLQQLKICMYICGFFGALAFSGLYALGPLYFRLWLPNEDTQIIYILSVLTAFTYIMDFLLQPVYYINALTLKNKIPCWVTVAGGLLNVIGMVLLLRYTNLGVYCVVLTTAAIMFVINFFFNPLYAAHCLQIKSKYFYKIIVKHLIACALMTGCFSVIGAIANPQGWGELVLTASIMVAIGGILYVCIVPDMDEKREMVKMVHKK